MSAFNEYGEATARVEILVDDKRLEPCITEFLAINDGPLLDGDGKESDWIELYNPSLSDTDLTGWALTDDIADIAKWKFPGGTILAAGEYRIVFATSRPLEAANPDAAGYLHTNFNLMETKVFLPLFDRTDLSPNSLGLNQKRIPKAIQICILGLLSLVV